MQHWWIETDYVEYRSPVEDGKILLNIDMVAEDYDLDPTGLKFHFDMGKRDSGPIPDFACWRPCAFMVSERGFKIFRQMFNAHGRSWPVKIGELPYHIVLADKVLGAFDYQHSRYNRSGLLDDIKEDISRVLAVRFLPGFSTNLDLFRMKGRTAVFCEIIVSQKFRDIYEQNNLTGLSFLPTHDV